jgi:hypothetical protein
MVGRLQTTTTHTEPLPGASHPLIAWLSFGEALDHDAPAGRTNPVGAPLQRSGSPRPLTDWWSRRPSPELTRCTWTPRDRRKWRARSADPEGEKSLVTEVAHGTGRAWGFRRKYGATPIDGHGIRSGHRRSPLPTTAVTTEPLDRSVAPDHHALKHDAAGLQQPNSGERDQGLRKLDSFLLGALGFGALEHPGESAGCRTWMRFPYSASSWFSCEVAATYGFTWLLVYDVLSCWGDTIPTVAAREGLIHG